jgi:hypothetical protein
LFLNVLMEALAFLVRYGSGLVRSSGSFIIYIVLGEFNVMV